MGVFYVYNWVHISSSVSYDSHGHFPRPHHLIGKKWCQRNKRKQITQNANVMLQQDFIVEAFIVPTVIIIVIILSSLLILLLLFLKIDDVLVLTNIVWNQCGALQDSMGTCKKCGSWMKIQKFLAWIITHPPPPAPMLESPNNAFGNTKAYRKNT